MRPGSDEFAPFYQRYIDQIAGTALEALMLQEVDFPSFIRRIPADKGDFAYAAGKWTVKEVIGHVIDTERIMAYRALRIARGDRTPLAGFEQDDYVAQGKFVTQNLESLAHEFEILRRSNLLLFETFDEASLLKSGTASGNRVTVRALMYIIAGHTLHHLAILKERYLG